MDDVGQQPESCSSYAAAIITSLPETSSYGRVNRPDWITDIAIVGSSRHQTETRFAEQG